MEYLIKASEPLRSSNPEPPNLLTKNWYFASDG